MPRNTADLTESELSFLADRHLGTLTTMWADGSPHVIAIAFVYDAGEGLVRIITSDNTQKIRNVERDPRAAVNQIDGRRWLTLEGRAVVTSDADRVSAAVAAFESRYRPASENPNRVAIELVVTRILGRA